MGVASGLPDVNRFSEYMVQITTCFLLLFSWEPLIAQGCLLAMLDCQDVAWNLGRGKSLLDVWSIKDRLKCKKEKEKKNRAEKHIQVTGGRKPVSVRWFLYGISLFLLFYLLLHITFNTQHLIILKQSLQIYYF